MEIKAYLEFLRRRWILVLLAPIIAGYVAYTVTQQITPIYRTTATLLINRVTVPTPSPLATPVAAPTGPVYSTYDDIVTSERLTNTLAQLVERPEVIEEVKRRLGVEWLANSYIAGLIEVAPVADSQLVAVTVEDPNPDFAAALANTTVQVFSDLNAGGLVAAGTLSLGLPAEAPDSPVRPNLEFNVAFGIVLGLFLAVALGVLLDYMDETIKSRRDVEDKLELPSLGTIGSFHPEAGPAFAPDLSSPSAEAFRQLRTNVLFASLGRETRSIVVTSANPREGKSTVAANLAAVLAQAGEKVIIVDTNLRRPALSKVFDARQSPGLTRLLLEDVGDPAAGLVPTRWKNLRFLPAGPVPPNPSELLTSARMQRLSAGLRGAADYVIYDAPPVLAVTDAIVLGARADATVLVTRASRTRTETVRSALQLLRQANVSVLGVVLNRARLARSWTYHNGGARPGPIEVEADEPLKQGRAETLPPARTVVNEAMQYLQARRAGLATEDWTGGSQVGVRHLDDMDQALETVTYPATAEQLGAAMSDLEDHLDQTVELIRWLRSDRRAGSDRR